MVNARANRFPLVDSLRAIAALCVLLTHTAVAAGVSGNPHSALSPYAQRLDVGVAIFFLISGLLLYRPFVAARFRGGAPAVGPYAWRRLLRIAPAYWLALTVTALWVGTSAYELGVFSSSGFPTYYLLLQTYRGRTLSGGLVQGWTLTIEITFYAFLPLYAWAMRPPGERAAGARRGDRSCASELIGLVVLVIVSEAWKAVVLGGQSPHQVVITPALDALPSFLDQFALGMGLAVVSAWIEQRGTRSAMGASASTAPRGCHGRSPRWPSTSSASASGSAHGSSPPWGGGSTSGESGCTPRWRSACCCRRSSATRPAACPGASCRCASLAWLGLISYGIYLWQTTVLAQLQRWNFGAHSIIHPWLWWSAGTLVMTAAIAAASYYLLERPLLSLKNVFGTQRSARGRGIGRARPRGPAAHRVDRRRAVGLERPVKLGQPARELVLVEALDLAAAQVRPSAGRDRGVHPRPAMLVAAEGQAGAHRQPVQRPGARSGGQRRAALDLDQAGPAVRDGHDAPRRELREHVLDELRGADQAPALAPLAGAGHADRRLRGDQRRALGVVGSGARADVLAGQQAAADTAGGAVGEARMGAQHAQVVGRGPLPGEGERAPARRVPQLLQAVAVGDEVADPRGELVDVAGEDARSCRPRSTRAARPRPARRWASRTGPPRSRSGPSPPRRTR